MRIAFVSPALNEEHLLRRTVEANIGLMDRLVIVDDGSTDRTGEIADALAREHPGKIDVIHQKNTGIGGAVKAGLRLLLEREDIDAMGVLASDDQFDPRLIPRFRQILEEMPEVDVAKGSRFMHPESLHQMPSFRKWGNRGGKSKQSTFRLKGARFVRIGGVGGGVGPHEWAGGRQFGGPGRRWAPGSRWRSVERRKS